MNYKVVVNMKNYYEYYSPLFILIQIQVTDQGP